MLDLRREGSESFLGSTSLLPSDLSSITDILPESDLYAERFMCS